MLFLPRLFPWASLAIACLLLLGFSTPSFAQESEPVPGQEVVAAAADLDAAVEGLFPYELTFAEVADFLATIDALEAWARANQFTWNGVFDTTPMLEGIRELPFWKQAGRDPLPFMTTLSKVYLLFLYADPYDDTLQRAAWAIDNHQQRLEDPHLDEEDRALYLRNLENAKAELARIESIPVKTRELYDATKDYLNPALDRWSVMGELEEKPPVAFTHASHGMRMLSSAGWMHDETRDEMVYVLPWMDAEATVVSLPWPEDFVIEDSTISAVLVGILGGDDTAEILAQERGERNGHADVRVAYRFGSTEKRGIVYLSAVGEHLHMLNFLVPESGVGLFTPILEEALLHLEFGEYPMPLLVDRSIMGYQVYVERPWTTLLDAPEGVDLRLEYTGVDALIDFSVVETTMTVEQFEAFTDFMHSSNLEEYVEPHDLGSGVGQMFDVPFGYSEIYGPRTGFPEGQEQELHIRQVFLNLGDRLLHINMQAVVGSWEQFGPLAEALLQDMQFPEAKTVITYDRSHLGYVLEASSKWLETEHLAEGIEFQLVYQGPEIVLGASRAAIADGETVTEAYMKNIQAAVVQNYEEASEATFMSGDFGGTAFGTETFYANLPGAEVDGDPLRIVSFTAYFRMPEDVLVFSIMTRESDWEVAGPEIEALLNNLQFVTSD